MRRFCELLFFSYVDIKKEESERGGPASTEVMRYHPKWVGLTS